MRIRKWTEIYKYNNYNAGNRINVWTFSQTHISKSGLKHGHISRFCSVFQLIQVISSAEFVSAEEVNLSPNSWIWIHESDFKGFFLEKRPWKGFSIKCSNSGINESTPQTQSNVFGYQVKQNLKSRSWTHFSGVWESGQKIDPATGLSIHIQPVPLRWDSKCLSEFNSKSWMVVRF